MKKVMLSTVAVAALMLSGCQTTKAEDMKPVFGTIVGGTAGGLLGNQVGSGNGNKAAIAAGALLGAIIGNHIATIETRPHSQSVVINQHPLVYPECKHLNTSGEISACNRGVAARKSKEQADAENRAYQCGYRGSC